MATGTHLDANRQARQALLQRRALRGSRRAARELRGMNLLYWWRDGRAVIE
jgi:hypothetical protein